VVSSLELAGPAVAPQLPRVSNSSFLSANPPHLYRGGPSIGAALAARDISVTGFGQFNIGHFSEGSFTEITIRKMHEAVLSVKTDAAWREQMERIRASGRRVGAIGWKDYLGEAKWFNHVYRNVIPIDYVRDPHQVEMVQSPWLTLYKQAGDCDDSSSLTAGSLGVLGAPHKFRTYKADASRPKEWTHVTCFVFVPASGWLNIDLTVRNAPVGWEPVGFEYRDWPEPRW